MEFDLNILLGFALMRCERPTPWSFLYLPTSKDFLKHFLIECVCARACIGQRRVSDLLRLELQALPSFLM